MQLRLGQAAAEGQLATVDAERDGPLTHSEVLGDLRVRPLLDESLDEHVPADRRQERQGPVEEGRQFVTLQADLDVDVGSQRG